MPKGKFIIVEGGDGSGKTTFVNFLKKKHPEFVYSREPGGVGFSQNIRDLVLSDGAKTADSLAMFNLFWASRAENIAKVIIPALREGKVVISDRFDASTYAFQIGEDHKLENIFWMMRSTCLRGITPVYLDFDVSVEISRHRLNGRDEKNHFDERDDEYRNRVHSFYKRFFRNRVIRSVFINANQSQDQVIDTAYDSLKKILLM